MKSHDFTVRPETPADYRAGEALTREAFWNHFVPGCDEHYLLHVMRDSPHFLPELTFVAEQDGHMVGHIAYAKAYVLLDDGQRHEVLCFGPLSVLPECQGAGVGSALVNHSMKAALKLGYRAILLLGDPVYYARLGFVPAERFDIRTAEDVYLDPLQAVELVPGALSGVSGRFFEGEAYVFDAEQVTQFDTGFPPKERLEGLPSQLRFQALVSMQKPRK